MRTILWSLVIVVFFVGCGDTGNLPPTVSDLPGQAAQPDQAAQADPADQAAEVGPEVLHLSQTQLVGQAVYNTLCWTCHGRSGHGDGPSVLAGVADAPPDFHTAEYSTLTPVQLRDQFQFVYGEPNERHPSMPAIAAVMNEEGFLAALEFVPALVYPSEVPGSQLYGEMMYGLDCAPCHGASGRGDGLAAQMSTIAPASLIASEMIRERDYDAMFKRVHRGSPRNMPSWGMSLTDTEIWDLVAYIGSFQDLFAAPIWVEGM